MQVSIIDTYQQIYQTVFRWRCKVALCKVRPLAFVRVPILDLVVSSGIAGTGLHFNFLCKLTINTFDLYF